MALEVCTNTLFNKNVKWAELAELQLKQLIKQQSIHSPIYSVPAECITSQLTRQHTPHFSNVITQLYASLMLSLITEMTIKR